MSDVAQHSVTYKLTESTLPMALYVVLKARRGLIDLEGLKTKRDPKRNKIAKGEKLK